MDVRARERTIFSWCARDGACIRPAGPAASAKGSELTNPFPPILFALRPPPTQAMRRLCAGWTPASPAPGDVCSVRVRLRHSASVRAPPCAQAERDGDVVAVVADATVSAVRPWLQGRVLRDADPELGPGTRGTHPRGTPPYPLPAGPERARGGRGEGACASASFVRRRRLGVRGTGPSAQRPRPGLGVGGEAIKRPAPASPAGRSRRPSSGTSPTPRSPFHSRHRPAARRAPHPPRRRRRRLGPPPPPSPYPRAGSQGHRQCCSPATVVFLLNYTWRARGPPSRGGAGGYETFLPAN